MITGRVVDARTGQGVAGIRLQSSCRELGSNLVVGEATTDAEGRYKIAARPGRTLIEPVQVPKTHLALDYGEAPVQEVKADQAWPDLKLLPATALDGLVVNESGRPVAGAEVYLRGTGRSRPPGVDPIRTGPDGSFHLDQLDPVHPVSLWARAGAATTEGTITVRPGEVKRKLGLTIDAEARAADPRSGEPTSRASELPARRSRSGGIRPFPSDNQQGPRASLGILLDIATTAGDGSVRVRGLWAGLSYDLVIEARGYDKAKLPERDRQGRRDA